MTKSPNSTGSKPIGQVADDVLQSIFGRSKVVIGVVHLAPLPGAPRYDGEAVEAIYQPVSYTHLTLPTILRV